MFEELFNQMEGEKRSIEMTDDDAFHAMVGLIQMGGIGEAHNIFTQVVADAEGSEGNSDDDGGVEIEFEDDDDKPLWEQQKDDELRGFILESQAEDVTGLKFVLAKGKNDAIDKAQTAGVPYEVWGTMAELHSELGQTGVLDFTNAQHDFYKSDDEE